MNIRTILQNYKKILSNIPTYILEAAQGTKDEETWSPKSGIETTMVAQMRMNIDGTITRYNEQSKETGKIADWLMKYGWKPGGHGLQRRHLQHHRLASRPHCVRRGVGVPSRGQAHRRSLIETPKSRVSPPHLHLQHVYICGLVGQQPARYSAYELCTVFYGEEGTRTGCLYCRL